MLGKCQWYLHNIFLLNIRSNILFSCKTSILLQDKDYMQHLQCQLGNNLVCNLCMLLYYSRPDNWLGMQYKILSYSSSQSGKHDKKTQNCIMSILLLMNKLCRYFLHLHNNHANIIHKHQMQYIEGIPSLQQNKLGISSLKYNSQLRISDM